jgi:hypothetical protein
LRRKDTNYRSIVNLPIVSTQKVNLNNNLRPTKKHEAQSDGLSLEEVWVEQIKLSRFIPIQRQPIETGGRSTAGVNKP